MQYKRESNSFGSFFVMQEKMKMFEKGFFLNRT